jgi:hypothetical protein
MRAMVDPTSEALAGKTGHPTADNGVTPENAV